MDNSNTTHLLKKTFLSNVKKFISFYTEMNKQNKGFVRKMNILLDCYNNIAEQAEEDQKDKKKVKKLYCIKKEIEIKTEQFCVLLKKSEKINKKAKIFVSDTHADNMVKSDRDGFAKIINQLKIISNKESQMITSIRRLIANFRTIYMELGYLGEHAELEKLMIQH